jgi:hypothetical protein
VEIHRSKTNQNEALTSSKKWRLTAPKRRKAARLPQKYAMYNIKREEILRDILQK